MGNRGKRPGRAFTLVELLVVISVIMVLVGLVLPVLLRAAGRARVANCISNLGQLAKAMVSYQGNYEGFLPSPAHVDTKGGDPGALDDSILNDDTLFDGDREEVDDGYLYHSYTWRGKILSFVGTRGKDEESLYGVYRCPSVRNFKGHKSFYGFNAFMGMHNGEALRDSTGELKLTHMDDVLDTGRTFLIGENNEGHWVVKPSHPPSDFTFVEVSGGDVDYPGQKYEGQVYARHSDRATWVFCDGHAEALTIEKTHERECFFWRDLKPER